MSQNRRKNYENKISFSMFLIIRILRLISHYLTGTYTKKYLGGLGLFYKIETTCIYI